MESWDKPQGVRRITTCALLIAIALTIFLVEAQIPVPIPLPGVKLGLSNVVTVYAVFVLGKGDATLILISRIFLGAVFSGQMSTLFYSAGGGAMCLLVMCLLSKVLNVNQIWFCSPVAAVFHNIGQILVAMFMMGTPAVLGYLPYLVLIGLCSGLFTGLCAQMVVKRIGRG